MEYYLKECKCPTESISIDFSTELIETEDLEETDDGELTEDQFLPHNVIWQEIVDNFNDERRQIDAYKLSNKTECEVPLNPAVNFLEKKIFPLLVPQVLETTINTAKKLECIKHQKNAFNGIDFIAEMLWHLNPKYPERKNNWTYIFDMDWVTEWLKNHPRPYYPFSWIWSRDWAATKIQAAMRGHWVRCREDVQEMRQFWKVLEKEKSDPETNHVDSVYKNPTQQ